MKALSLTQPWATLVAIGAKRIETRCWYTAYRGELAIAAAKGFPKAAREFTAQPVVYEAAKSHGYRVEWAYPTAVVVATCSLVDVLPMEAYRCLPGVFDDYPEFDTPQERAFGDFNVFDLKNGRRRWAFVLENMRPLPEPVPAKGALGLWEWNPATEGK